MVVVHAVMEGNIASVADIVDTADLDIADAGIDTADADADADAVVDAEVQANIDN